VGAVEGPAPDGDPVVGGLDDGVLLGADAPAGGRGGAARAAGVAAAVPAVPEPGWRVAVSGDHHHAVADDHRAAGARQTGGPAGGAAREPQEIGGLVGMRDQYGRMGPPTSSRTG
jgi:hypothetical protein